MPYVYAYATVRRVAAVAPPPAGTAPDEEHGARKDQTGRGAGMYTCVTPNGVSRPGHGRPA